MTSYGPLQFPTSWPPPTWLRPLGDRSRWYRVPLLSGILWSFTDECREERCIQGEVIAQMAGRPAEQGEWPLAEDERRVVACLSEAFCVEKGLPNDRVALHPDDPVVLLLWGGYYDDLTPLMFCQNLTRNARIEISPRELFEFVARGALVAGHQRDSWIRSRRTVRDVAEFCASHRKRLC